MRLIKTAFLSEDEVHKKLENAGCVRTGNSLATSELWEAPGGRAFFVPKGDLAEPVVGYIIDYVVSRRNQLM